jgi:predicted transcriptional regulator of viral defense system
MLVKNDRLNQIRKIIEDQNGVLLTSNLTSLDIPRTYLTILEEKGEIMRESRGVYTTPDAISDDMLALQSRYQTAIFSHETALYLHDLTDRSPLVYSVTVPSGYNASALKENGAKVYFIKRELHELGLTTKSSSHGNAVQTYDLERTICDILRSRKQMDIQLVNEALKRYVKRNDKQLNILYRYAELLRIQRIAREYLEILL